MVRRRSRVRIPSSAPKKAPLNTVLFLELCVRKLCLLGYISFIVFVPYRRTLRLFPLIPCLTVLFLELCVRKLCLLGYISFIVFVPYRQTLRRLVITRFLCLRFHFRYAFEVGFGQKSFFVGNGDTHKLILSILFRRDIQHKRYLGIFFADIHTVNY